MEKRIAEYGRMKAKNKPAASAVLSIEGRRMNLWLVYVCPSPYNGFA